MKEWKETRLKNLLAIPLSYGLNVSSDEDKEDWPRYIRITDFDDYNKLDSNTFKSLPLHIAEPALLEDGDLLFARSGATVGKTFLYTQLPNGACYAGYLIRARFNKKSVLPKFVSYFTKGEEYNQWKNKYCIQTTIENISADKYNQLPLCIPSLQVQQRIVEYLDAKTTEIDKKIELLGKKRDTYKRLKIATINHAVTRGLDEHVKLKDSGNELFGEIPEHWDVNRLKKIISDIETGLRPTEEEQEVLSIGGEHIQNGAFYLEHKVYISQKTYEKSRGKIHKGDILVVKDGATIGKCMYVNFMPEEKMLINEHVYRIEIHKFYFYYLKSSISSYWFRSRNMSSAQESIVQNTIFNLPITLPPLSEQKQIASYLDDRCAKIDEAVTIIDKQIDALKRLKRSLINEVVTGKRKV